MIVTNKTAIKQKNKTGRSSETRALIFSSVLRGVEWSEGGGCVCGGGRCVSYCRSISPEYSHHQEGGEVPEDQIAGDGGAAIDPSLP